MNLKTTIQLLSIVVLSLLLCGCTYPTILGDNLNLDPNVVIDRTLHPPEHAIFGMTDLPEGGGTYCIFAETLSRGEPVDVVAHWGVVVPRTPDKFGSTKNELMGNKIGVADNNNVVNGTFTFPDGAFDTFITTSYSYYSGENNIHIVVWKC